MILLCFLHSAVVKYVIVREDKVADSEEIPCVVIQREV